MGCILERISPLVGNSNTTQINSDHDYDNLEASYNATGIPKRTDQNNKKWSDFKDNVDGYKIFDNEETEHDTKHQVSALATKDLDEELSVYKETPTIDQEESISYSDTTEMTDSTHQNQELHHGIIVPIEPHNQEFHHGIIVGETECSASQQQFDPILRDLSSDESIILTSESEQEVKLVVGKIWENLKRNLRNYRSEENNQANQNSQSRAVAKRKGWKVIHLFISSTFTDFFSERELLVKKVLTNLLFSIIPLTL